MPNAAADNQKLYREIASVCNDLAQDIRFIRLRLEAEQIRNHEADQNPAFMVVLKMHNDAVDTHSSVRAWLTACGCESFTSQVEPCRTPPHS